VRRKRHNSLKEPSAQLIDFDPNRRVVPRLRLGFDDLKEEPKSTSKSESNKNYNLNNQRQELRIKALPIRSYFIFLSFSLSLSLF
jgi:hypothetical protein